MQLQSAPAPQGVADTFENLSSYQQIFGLLNYCDCSECKSILGPAAYLVDLLRIIDKAITQPNSKTIPKGLSFNDRRPDIAKIKLTCDNTNNLLPYLQIVNDILEENLLQPLKTTDVFKTLTNIFYPFNLPFNLPLNQIRTYLLQDSTSLFEIFMVMNKNQNLSIAAAREYLDISLEEFTNLKNQTGNNLLTVLSNNYGLSITADNLAGLNKVETFTSQVGITLQNLREIFYQNLNIEEIFNISGAYTPTINGDILTFIQNKNKIFGTYNSNSGVIEGNIIGNIVQATWTQKDATGYCEFTFTNDCSSFTGKWNKDMGETWEIIPWNGTRKIGDIYASETSGIIPHSFFINKVFLHISEYSDSNAGVQPDTFAMRFSRIKL
jgi:hypothetical protein